MSSEVVIGFMASLSALVAAFFTGLVALRRERRDVATADVLELRAHRDAWDWAVRTIYRLLPGITVEESTSIKADMAQHQSRIDHPTVAEPGKELKS